MTDTPPSVRALFRGMLLARSGEERLKMGCDMFDCAMALARAGIDANYRPETVSELSARLFEHVYRDLDPAITLRVVERLAGRSRLETLDASVDSRILDP